MKLVFVDTLYWITAINPKDQWHHRALEVEATLSGRLLTTEAVLTEVLNFFSSYGEQARLETAEMVRDILADENVEAVSVAHSDFLAGLDLYQSRLDKGYSLTDCISMNLMRERGITEALTHDHHFAQEGFTILL